MNRLSDFMSLEIVRGEKAEIIFDYYEGKPVRLIGFEDDVDKTDFEILENGWNYYCRLKEKIEK